MKDYKVEVVITTLNQWSFKIEKLEAKIQEEIQERIDKMVSQGYKLISTDSVYNGGMFNFTYLYFER